MRTTYDSVSPANATLGASIANANGDGTGVRIGGWIVHQAGARGEKMPSLSGIPGESHRPPTRAGVIGMCTSPVGLNVSVTDANTGAGPQSP